MLHLLLFMAFTYYKTVTIAHTLCGASDSTNFPVAIWITDADLKTVANGGKVQNSSGYDIRPFSDSGLSIALTFELVPNVYSPTTGVLEMYVKIPTVSHTSDTLFYLAFGDSGISTDGSSNTTWDANYISVYHLGNGSSVSTADSSQSGNTLTNSGATATTGAVVGGAAAFDGVSAYMLGANTVNVPHATVEGWFQTISGLGTQVSFSNNGPGSGATDKILHSGDDGTGVYDSFWFVYDGSGVDLAPLPGSGRPVNQWYVSAGSADGTNARLYAQGVLQRTMAAGDTYTGYSSPNIMLGGSNANGYVIVQQIMDEIRISDIARSTDWLLTSFNNQWNVGTFLTFGALTPVSAGSDNFDWLQRRAVPLPNWRPTWIQVP